jgi:hypothetical protein
MVQSTKTYYLQAVNERFQHSVQIINQGVNRRLKIIQNSSKHKTSQNIKKANQSKQPIDQSPYKLKEYQYEAI